MDTQTRWPARFVNKSRCQKGRRRAVPVIKPGPRSRKCFALSDSTGNLSDVENGLATAVFGLLDVYADAQE